jgi:1-aminocyclopropane-1-carboxylate deaminase/D-cysteine desulfhydrase-like pyridoxal-dependent ACC family enzyme
MGYGLRNCVSELYQDLPKRVKGILTAAGSGGTTAGLVIGSKLFGIPLKVFAVNVLTSKSLIENRVMSVIEKTIAKFNLDISVSHRDFEVIDGYSKEGYRNITDKKVKVIKEFAQSTGILLDPAYTGKLSAHSMIIFFLQKRLLILFSSIQEDYLVYFQNVNNTCAFNLSYTNANCSCKIF